MKKGKNGGPTVSGQGGFTKPAVGNKFHYQPKKPPPRPKKMDVNKKKAADVASLSGTKIATFNQFDTLNMDDTDDFGIPTKEVNKVVDSGSTMEAKEDGLQQTGEVGPTPIVKKIRELEKLIIDGKATLVNDDGHPIKKVDLSRE